MCYLNLYFYRNKTRRSCKFVYKFAYKLVSKLVYKFVSKLVYKFARMPSILTPFLQLLYATSGPIQHLGVPHKDVDIYFRAIISHNTLSKAFRTVLDSLTENEFNHLYIETCINVDLKNSYHFRLKELLTKAIVSLIINPFLDTSFINVVVNIMIEPDRDFYEVVIGAKTIHYAMALAGLALAGLALAGPGRGGEAQAQAQPIANTPRPGEGQGLFIIGINDEIDTSDYLAGKIAIPYVSDWLDIFKEYYHQGVLESVYESVREISYDRLTKSLKQYGISRQFNFKTVPGTSLYGWLMENLKATLPVGSKRKAAIMSH